MLQRHMTAYSPDTQTILAVDNPGLGVSVHTVVVPSREYLSPEIEEVFRTSLDRSVNAYTQPALKLQELPL